MGATGTEAVASLPPRLTLEQAAAQLAQLRSALSRQSDPAPVIDAAALQECDSSAVAVLLELRRDMLRQGRTLNLRNSPQRLQDLVALYGVQELLPLA